MTPADFVTEIVIPTVREFRDEPQSRRRAYLACIVTFHIKDYLWKAGARNIEPALRGALSSGEFDAVRGICNGTKHVKADASHSIGFQAGDDVEGSPAHWDGGRWDESNWDDETGGRDIEHEERAIDVYSSVRQVLQEFQRQFPSHLSHCDLSDC